MLISKNKKAFTMVEMAATLALLGIMMITAAGFSKMFGTLLGQNKIITSLINNVNMTNQTLKETLDEATRIHYDGNEFTRCDIGKNLVNPLPTTIGEVNNLLTDQKFSTNPEHFVMFCTTDGSLNVLGLLNKKVDPTSTFHHRVVGVWSTKGGKINYITPIDQVYSEVRDLYDPTTFKYPLDTMDNLKLANLKKPQTNIGIRSLKITYQNQNVMDKREQALVKDKFDTVEVNLMLEIRDNFSRRSLFKIDKIVALKSIDFD